MKKENEFLNNRIYSINLQFFAKDGPGGEKTELPTAKKLEDARKKGQVAKSKDLVNAVSLILMFAIIKLYVSQMGEQIIKSFNIMYNQIGDLFYNYEYMTTKAYYKSLLIEVMKEMLLMVIPFLGVAVLVAIVVDVAQVGWKPTGETLKPKLSNINPLNGIKRIFSVKTLFNLIKQIVLIVVMCVVIISRAKSKVSYLYKLYDISLLSAIMLMGDVLLDIGFAVSAVYLIIAFGDLIFEKRKFKKDMMMTKQEVKEEWKNTEGSPEVKNKQRQKMREVSQRRMMQAVPEADVVITNPTHFAVALKYEQSSGKAPVVVAKGADYLAAKIKETAKENKVEIVENKPVARMLYYNVEIGEEIPQELYQAVAEILAFVYNLKHGNI